MMAAPLMLAVTVLTLHVCSAVAVRVPATVPVANPSFEEDNAMADGKRFVLRATSWKLQGSAGSYAPTLDAYAVDSGVPNGTQVLFLSPPESSAEQAVPVADYTAQEGDTLQLQLALGRRADLSGSPGALNVSLQLGNATLAAVAMTGADPPAAGFFAEVTLTALVPAVASGSVVAPLSLILMHAGGAQVNVDDVRLSITPAAEPTLSTSTSSSTSATTVDATTITRVSSAAPTTATGTTSTTSTPVSTTSNAREDSCEGRCGMETSLDGSCYCDGIFCILVGDCCGDFSSHCPLSTAPLATVTAPSLSTLTTIPEDLSTSTTTTPEGSSTSLPSPATSSTAGPTMPTSTTVGATTSTSTTSTSAAPTTPMPSSTTPTASTSTSSTSTTTSITATQTTVAPTTAATVSTSTSTASSLTHNLSTFAPLPPTEAFDLTFRGILEGEATPRRFITGFNDAVLLASTVTVENAAACATHCQTFASCRGFLIYAQGEEGQILRCRALESLGAPDGIVTSTISLSYTQLASATTTPSTSSTMTTSTNLTTAAAPTTAAPTTAAPSSAAPTTAVSTSNTPSSTTTAVRTSTSTSTSSSTSVLPTAAPSTATPTTAATVSTSTSTAPSLTHNLSTFAPLPPTEAFDLTFRGVLEGEATPRRFITGFNDAVLLASTVTVENAAACATHCQAFASCRGFLIYAQGEEGQILRCRVLESLGSPDGIVTSTVSLSYTRLASATTTSTAAMTSSTSTSTITTSTSVLTTEAASTTSTPLATSSSAPEVCFGGTILGTSTPCDCEGTCYACDIYSGGASNCTLCASSTYLHQGACYADCDAFPDVESHGGSLFGRTCLPAMTTTTGTSTATTSTAAATTMSTTGTTTSTSSTTTSSATLLESACIFGSDSVTGAACTCDDGNCVVCPTAETDNCDLCRNAKYLFQGECHDSCETFRDTLERGTSSFGRACVAGQPCNNGTLASSGDDCSCSANCRDCLLPDDGGDPICTVCTNDRFLYDGSCYADCSAFTGTSPLGRGPDGRVCG